MAIRWPIRRAAFHKVFVQQLSTQSPNYYEILGVERTATTQQIKRAFYELSKKYHPDRNPADRQAASEKFQQVASAYEVLGSDEKRKAYDLTLTVERISPSFASPYRRNARNTTKSYTDLDIDYKNFEQFQRSTRRRPTRNDHWDMPDEFYAEFGGRKFSSEYKFHNPLHNANYKDSRATAREKEEIRRMQEAEAERLERERPIPTFEQLLRQEQKRKAEEQRTAVFTSLATVLHLKSKMRPSSTCDATEELGFRISVSLKIDLIVLLPQVGRRSTKEGTIRRNILPNLVNRCNFI
ncbi:hypothetical protein AB6A40_007383 [Gnathostoma spinigerum]|uniref:J domain-containing protein n=1 Tax=Gnathostoma spinigerum TaxID=75299 RepID=A0ABD6ETQ1_9BILA